MNYQIKLKIITASFFIILSGCTNTDDLSQSEVKNPVKTEKAVKTEKKGIVLIDDDGNLGSFFKRGGNDIGSVNKYLWQASLEVLSFLPINSADPFSGIIMFGKGKAPGSAQIYDVTVYISDPALDARSLSVTVRSSNGVISSAAKREIENAILSKARQLRLKALDL